MIRKLLILCALSSPVLAQTTTIYTGTIKDLSGVPVTSGKVTFTLAPSTDSTIPGAGRFVPTTISCTINSDGTLSATGGGACTVASNTSLSPTGTSYKICIQPYYAQPGSCYFDYATTSTKDISTSAPTLNTGPVNYSGIPGPPLNFLGTWSSVVPYQKGVLVVYGNNTYISLQASNLNNIPSSSPTFWSLTQTTPAIVPGPSGTQTIVQPDASHPLSVNYFTVTGQATLPGGYAQTTPTAAQNLAQPGTTSFGVNTLNNVMYASQWCTTLSTPDQTCLSNVITALGSSQATLMINNQIPITSSITVPKNITLEVVGSGGFVLTGGGTLIVSGPFIAGMQQVFSGAGRGNVYFYGSNSNVSVLPQWFGATGNSKAGGFTATAGNGTLTLRPLSMDNWATGDVVTLVGAGVSGASYQATLTVASGVITASPVPSTTVSGQPMYTVDDSPALNAWANSVRGNTVLGLFYDNRSGYGPAKLYMPKGEYQVCTTPVLIYSSVVLEAEAGQTNTGASFSQCNPSISVLKIAPWNFDPQGVPHNWGNGNSYFKHVQIRGTYNAGSITRFPAIQYINASNLNSDNRWDHPMFESINGPGFGLGFITTAIGTISSGATTLTLTDGSTLCSAAFASSISQICNQFVIVGAGAAGANLTVTINAIGGTLPSTPVPGNPGGISYTVTFTPATSTTVTNPLIYPARDIVGNLTIEHAEMDGGQYFLLGQGNGTGSIVVEDAEIFNANNGGFVNNSLNGFGLDLDHVNCQGCGVVTASGSTGGAAIYWVDPANLKKLSINIHNSQFLPLMIGGVELGGNLILQSANNIAISNNRFYNTDTTGSTKLMFLQNAFDIHISDNQMYWDTAFNGDWSTSHLIEINDTNSLTPSTTITNNSIVNNSTTAFPVGMLADVPLIGAVVTGNNFHGTGTYGTLYSTNIANVSVRNIFTTQGFTQKQSTATPGTSTCIAGDIVWNSAPPAAGGSPATLGWICTVTGTSGTWKAISVNLL